MLVLRFTFSSLPRMMTGKKNGGTCHIAGIVQFFIALFSFFFFSIMPLGGLFGNYMRKESRKYVASQTFTATVTLVSPVMICGCLMVCGLSSLLENLSNLISSLTLSFRDPIRVLSHHENRIVYRGCNFRIDALQISTKNCTWLNVRYTISFFSSWILIFGILS